MKNFLLAQTIFCLLFLTGCAATMEQVGQSWQRETSGGYPAVVKVYSLDGKLIQTWEGHKVLPVTDDDGDPSLTFIIDGKKVTVQGLFTIEEINLNK